MTTPEPASYDALERRLEEVLGPEDAATLATVLASLATKDDLAGVKDDLAGVKDDLAGVNDRLGRVEHDVALLTLDLDAFKKDVHHEFSLIRTEMVATKHEIIGELGDRINTAITSQTRPLLVALVSTAALFAGTVLGTVSLVG